MKCCACSKLAEYTYKGTTLCVICFTMIIAGEETIEGIRKKIRKGRL